MVAVVSNWLLALGELSDAAAFAAPPMIPAEARAPNVLLHVSIAVAGLAGHWLGAGGLDPVPWSKAMSAIGRSSEVPGLAGVFWPPLLQVAAALPLPVLPLVPPELAAVH
jgi:hypothetical protein